MLLFWFLIITSFLIIVVSMYMSPDANSFSGALVGSSDLDLFKISKERGSKKLLKNAMILLGTILMIGAIIVRVYI